MALGSNGSGLVRLLGARTAPGVDRSDHDALLSVNGFDGPVDSRLQ